MIDPFGRTITYLRVSVTDRCNLRCRYCMPSEGVELLPHEQILHLEEIRDVVAAAAEMGVTKVRITGGEPLVRHGVVDLVGMLAAIEGVADLAMTTNGTLLARFAADLARAGLGRVNVSLDAIDSRRFREITRGGDVRDVFEGISAARAAGLAPIKLNCVVAESADEPDARDVADYARQEGLEVRFIREMDFGEGTFSVVEGGSGGDCPRCNRLRLSSDGRIRPCLFSDLTFSVRELGPAEAIRQAVAAKPEHGRPCTHNWIRGIGG